MSDLPQQPLFDASVLEAKMTAMVVARRIWLDAREKMKVAEAAADEAAESYNYARNDATDELFRQAGIEKFGM